MTQPSYLPTRPSPISSILIWVTALLLFAVGLGVRLFDLTDQPIDFHPTRQLRNAIVARGIYYAHLPDADPETRERAIAYGNSTGQYEPPIVETLVAYAYLAIGEETLWVSRLITTLFWLVGGLALFDLARRMAAGSSSTAALVSLGYYLILPFAVQASRSFQPDPGMVMWIVLSIYALYRWSENPVGKTGWGWALLAGILGGIAVLTKIVAAYIIAGAAVALVIATLGLFRFWRNLRVWIMAALFILPSALYYMGQGARASEYLQSWTISLAGLLVDPSVYARWFSLVQGLMGLAVLLLGLVGVLIARPRPRALLLGLWVGYALYGLFFPYQIYTHNYYHLQLVPIVALSILPISQLILDKLTEQPKTWRVLFTGIALAAIAFPAWVSIAEQKLDNYRNEPAYWQEIASYLPVDGKIVALTQDYGYRLMYYGWRKVSLWPNRGERQLAALRGNDKQFEDYFARTTEGKSYFLITAFNQFNDQPDLKEALAKRFPLVAQGVGYLIYDLEHPLPANLQ